MELLPPILNLLQSKFFQVERDLLTMYDIVIGDGSYLVLMSFGYKP